MLIRKLAHGFGPIRAGTLLGDLDLAPTRERLREQKQIRYTMSLILVVVALKLAWCDRQRDSCFADQLLAGFIHTDHRMSRIRRALIDRQHIFQGGHKLGAMLGRNRPILLQVWLQFVFFRVRRTVSYETEGTCCNSTNRSASRRNVHLARPSGAGPQASATRCASAWPSNLRSYWRMVGFGRKAASSPSSTKRWRTRATVVACTSRASLMASSLQAGASGPVSAFSKMRACSSARAAALPLRIIWESCACSSVVNRTIYFFMAGLEKRL